MSEGCLEACCVISLQVQIEIGKEEVEWGYILVLVSDVRKCNT